MTPYEIGIRAEIYNDVKKNESFDKVCMALTNAYYTEVFHRMKEMKELSYYIEELEEGFNKPIIKPDKVQTPEQIEAQVKRLNDMFGGKVVYVDTDGNEIP